MFRRKPLNLFSLILMVLIYFLHRLKLSPEKIARDCIELWWNVDEPSLTVAFLINLKKVLENFWRTPYESNTLNFFPKKAVRNLEKLMKNFFEYVDSAKIDWKNCGMKMVSPNTAKRTMASHFLTGHSAGSLWLKVSANCKRPMNYWLFTCSRFCWPMLDCIKMVRVYFCFLQMFAKVIVI